MEQEINEIYAVFKNQLNSHFSTIKNIIKESGVVSWEVEGNCLYHHCTLIENDKCINKQKNLLYFGSKATNICEIGFNAGHSALIMHLNNTSVSPRKFTIFDIGRHKYTVPTLNYFKNIFPEILVEYIEGNSLITLPNWIVSNPGLIGTYDLVHIDGGHDDACIHNDMAISVLLVSKGGFIIFDDAQIPSVVTICQIWIDSGYFRIAEQQLDTTGGQHIILEKIK